MRCAIEHPETVPPAGMPPRNNLSSEVTPMKIRNFRSARLVAMASAALAFAAAGAADTTLEGRISQVTSTSLVLDHTRTLKFDPAIAECFDDRNVRTTCATLVAVGYVDKARLTLLGDTVRRVDILQLQQ